MRFESIPPTLISGVLFVMTCLLFNFFSIKVQETKEKVHAPLSTKMDWTNTKTYERIECQKEGKNNTSKSSGNTHT